MPLSPLVRLRNGIALSGLALLGACATPLTLPTDTTLTSATQTLGKPTMTCPLPDGGTRAIWSQQPLGQYGWAINFNAQDIATSREAILTDAAFARLHEGKWTEQDVLCAFGPPADTTYVGLPSSRQLLWSYRYRQDSVWNSLMNVQFSQDGIVNSASPGPDPRFDDNPFWFGF